MHAIHFLSVLLPFLPSFLSQCPEGFYGTDTLSCTPCQHCSANASFASTCSVCKTCDPNAWKISPCPANSLVDVSHCHCNAGYYGDGLVCYPCKICHFEAVQVTSCTFNSATDVSECKCNMGYYGDGVECKAYPSQSRSDLQNISIVAGAFLAVILAYAVYSSVMWGTVQKTYHHPMHDKHHQYKLIKV